MSLLSGDFKMRCTFLSSSNSRLQRRECLAVCWVMPVCVYVCVWELSAPVVCVFLFVVFSSGRLVRSCLYVYVCMCVTLSLPLTLTRCRSLSPLAVYLTGCVRVCNAAFRLANTLRFSCLLEGFVSYLRRLRSAMFTHALRANNPQFASKLSCW